MVVPTVSIVIPTYREVENLPLLAEKIDAALREAQYTYELIIADDDSGDGTPAAVERLAEKYPIKLLSRFSNRGLSPAVIDGINMATGKVVIVMDADLSHPPECIAKLAAPLLSRDADFSVGSRYVEGGGLHSDWPWWRRLNSYGATFPAKFLTSIRDPMSGFFGLRRADMPAAENLSPIGYKIGLELAVKIGVQPSRICEVPILFRNRAYGESKMNLREQINYMRHLRRLYHYRWPKRMEISQFLLVGASGLLIDVAVYVLLSTIGLPHLLSRAIAYWPAATSNWFFNRIMTFKERERHRPFSQWIKYVLFSGIGFSINWGTYALLTVNINFFAEHLLLALFVGVLVGTMFNFVASDWFVFQYTKRSSSVRRR